MSKQILVAAIKKVHHVSDKAAREIVDAMTGAVATTLKKEGRFALPDLGNLKVNKLPARKGRNPRTGETIKIPARKRVRFTSGTALKNKIG